MESNHRGLSAILALRPKEPLRRPNVRRPRILRQTVQKHPPVLLLQYAVIQQAQQPAILQRTNQPAEPLLERNHRARHLILEERIAAVLVDGLDARRHHWIIRHRKRQPVDDHAAQLLSLHVHPLPERRGRKQHAIRRHAELLQQRILGRAALQKHGKLQLAQQPLVKLVHERVAGEQAERPPAANLQQLPHSLRGLFHELRLARVWQIRRHIQQRLAGVVEVRRDDHLARMLQAQPPANVVESSAHSQRGRRQHRCLQVIEQRLPQNVRYCNRRRLQKHVPLRAASPAPLTPALNPEYGVLLVRLYDEPELHPQLLNPAAQVVYFVGLVRHRLQFVIKMQQRVQQPDKLVAVFLQKFRPVVERKPPISRRQQRKEELRSLPHPRRCRQRLGQRKVRPP